MTDLLVSLIAERLQKDRAEIPVDEDFVNLGLESLDAVILSGHLEDRLGYPVDPTLFLHNRNIAEVADALSVGEVDGRALD